MLCIKHMYAACYIRYRLIDYMFANKDIVYENIDF